MGKVCYVIDPEEMLQAAQRGDVVKVRQLLASDTTLANAKGAHNKTPLHWAAEKNYPELAELLVTAGADINAEVSWGMTSAMGGQHGQPRRGEIPLVTVQRRN